MTKQTSVVLTFEKSQVESEGLTLHLEGENVVVRGRKSVIFDAQSVVRLRKHSKGAIEFTGWPKVDNGSREKVICRVEGDEKSLLELQTHLNKHNSCLRNGKRGRLLVFVNPFSGTKKALKVWSTVRSMLDEAGVSYEAIVTERQNHARDSLQTLDLANYDGVVSVSGDGLLFEVLNGMASRPDWSQLRSRLALGLVPGGTGNAVHHSLLHQQGERFEDAVTVAGLNIASGSTRKADYMECTNKNGRFASIFGVAWGCIPESDYGSESIRWLGPMRNYVWLAWRWVWPQYFTGTVHYLEAGQGQEGDSELVSVPPLSQPVPQHWQTVSGTWLNVYACKQSYLDHIAFFLPECKMDDGYVWLMFLPVMTRLEILTWFLNFSSAWHLRHPGTKLVKVKAWRIVPDSCQDGVMTADAEHLECGPVQGRIVPGGCKMMVK